MSAERSPALIASIAAVLVLSIGGWLFLRAVEDDEAARAASEVAAAEGETIRSNIAGSVASVDALAAALDRVGVDDPSILSSLAARSDLTGDSSAITEIAVVVVDGDDLVVRSLVGAVDPGPLVGSTVPRSANLDDLLADVDEAGLLAAPTPEVLDTVQQLFEAEPTSVVLIAPVRTGATTSDYVMAQYDVERDLPSGIGPFEVRLEHMAVGSSSSFRPADDGSTEVLAFEAAHVEWQLRAGSSDVLVLHRGSWILLVAGVIVAGGLSVVAWALELSRSRAERLERIEFDARHDPLTGLTNRKGLTDALAACLGDRRTNNLVGVLLLDLDRLKVVNDSIGHSAGDEVLAAVADRLRQAVREDDIVGRFGGDEFIVVSSGVPAIRDLTMLADRILESLREPAVLSDESSQMISASIGIAYVTGGEGDAETLLRDADVAMYKAKEGGGGRYVVFDAELREQAVARLEVERELRRAIRTGQLHVHYQPIVDARSGGVDRLEALVRWEHPVRGMMAPGAFLSVAAESGLIVDVGEHVLRESCRQAAAWTAAVGHPVMVSVNVAERQLIDSGLLELVQRVLAETGLDPAQLELELSEEIIVERLDARLTILRELVDLGVKLAIDDFGTSRASLSMLKRLDMVSTLKIDRAFVVDVANDPVDRKIVTAIVALADSMGMETVAEGVEEAAQVSVLRSLGITLFQGFYFHRPAPGPKVASALTKPFEVPAAADHFV
jgi:diguanylate cyclase (GGDEF)-like protein